LSAFEHIVAGRALALDLPQPATEPSRATIGGGSRVQIAHTAGTAPVAVIDKGAASRTTLKTTSVATACCGLVELAKPSHKNPRKANSDGFRMTEVESELEQVATYRKAGKRTVHRLAQKGEMSAFKLWGTWRFRRSNMKSALSPNGGKQFSGAHQPIGRC
jgi:excisionase family DNA binding protein